MVYIILYMYVQQYNSVLNSAEIHEHSEPNPHIAGKKKTSTDKVRTICMYRHIRDSYLYRKKA